MGVRATSYAADIVLEALREMPSVSTGSMARLLFRRYPGVFTSEDHARSTIRWYRGKRGAKSRSKPAEFGIKCVVPDPVKQNWGPLVFPVKRGRGVVLSDIHVPYHDKRAVEVALRTARKRGATDFVLLNGDIIDCYKLSVYAQDPSARSFIEELEMLKAMITGMRCYLGCKSVIYKLGNHEDRLRRYLQVKAPELWGLPAFEWSEMIGDDGLTIVPHDVPIHVGKLVIVHGHELHTRSTPVNPARTLFMRMRECALAGHWHRQSTHTEVTARGTLVTTWSTGCLSQLHPEYSRINSWSHGFAVLEVDGDNFSVETYRILPDGTVRTT